MPQGTSEVEACCPTLDGIQSMDAIVSSVEGRSNMLGKGGGGRSDNI